MFIFNITLQALEELGWYCCTMEISQNWYWNDGIKLVDILL